ncbi:histidinol dehydrogenase [Candidatus Margulisiibacteriota bacterium]
MFKIVKKDKLGAELKNLQEKSALRIDAPEEKKVKEIIKNVQAKGDRALLEYSKKLDGVALEVDELRVTAQEIEAAYQRVSSSFLSALKVAIRNIGAYHERQKLSAVKLQTQSKYLGLRSLAIEKIGVYVPGGRAAYPSSVLMNVIPAQIAGCSKIVIVSPPTVSSFVLVAAAELGIKEIYRIGGAQAIAALAYGTATIPKVDKVVGPGNIYVMLAKKILYGIIGIDSLAGPSDILIIGDGSSNPQFIAADLISQAEHDPKAQSILVCTSSDLAEKVDAAAEEMLDQFERKSIIVKSIKENGRIFCVDNLEAAAAVANQIAPEHLEIMVTEPQQILDKIVNAGAVFIGPYSPVPLGDYIAGSNHTLPTAGGSRFSSPLTVYDFIKHQSIIGYSKEALEEEKDALITLAEAEGLDAHARSVEIRFK